MMSSDVLQQVSATSSSLGTVMKRTWMALLMGTMALAPPASRAAPPIPVMILDGESAGPYHDWRRVTPVLKKILDEAGLFATKVVTAPPAGADFGGFDPEPARYRAVVLNYDAPDGRWPAPLESSFEEYVLGGGGLVAVHGADNAFPGWRAYNEMIGVGGWRDRTEQSGPYWYYRDGRLVSDPAPGPAGSHGRRVPFQVVVRDTTHPITQGLPRVWMHHADELYARLRGPGRNMTVLATAYSDPANAGSGRDEPQLLAISYGQGRVFHTTWGHDVAALSSVDFVVTLQRGTEWAATGAVTQPAPTAFPTADTVSYRADLAAMDPRFVNGLDGRDPPVPGRSR
jgi:type 1 glutamine amidotransferase